MPFGDFAFSHVFKFTGEQPQMAYIDLVAGDNTRVAKVLAFDATLDGWPLSLTPTETETYAGRALEGHLVVVVAGVHAPIAKVKVAVQRSLTERRA